MHFPHASTPLSRRISRRYPWTRHISILSTLVTLIWFYAVYYGERITFRKHIDACRWEGWEDWPRDAVPHHLVFIADPQLVDAHTYPGRPWPLSSLTETYTDRYMTRNFRLINQQMDPDSVVFLGDLFDGGREWAPERARPLSRDGRQKLIDWLILDASKKEGERMGWDGKTDLHKYIPGENGRWNKFKMRQWYAEFKRFSRIFFDEEQLYPSANRELVPAYEAPVDTVAVENGAPNVTWQHYAVAGYKPRTIKTNLPGNHDLGFGSGVQVMVRDRFESHFGEANAVYVLGNHTFVSLDVLSLAASDEFVPEVGQVTEEKRIQYQDIWRPAHEFLSGLDTSGPKAAADALNQLYPGAHPRTQYHHEVVDPKQYKPVNKEKSEKVQLPVILLSHVPLYRGPELDCGSLRERGKSIPISYGYQYQNVLTPSLTSTVAKKVSAAGDMVHIFSGDDHDYCDVTHRFNIGRWSEDTQKERVDMRTVREVTVKSFSWAMGVRKPGFLLVSLWNPVDKHGKHVGECMDGATSGTGCRTIQTKLCLLPDQLNIFINYATLLGWTIAILFIHAVITGIRDKPGVEDDDDFDEYLPKISLARFAKLNGKLNGSPLHSRASSHGRQRAPSTSTSHSSGNSNQTLSVQRSYNARTRSVSPAPGTGTFTPNHSNYTLPSHLVDDGRPLIEKAGYFPQMRWRDPDEESDEESHLGPEPEDCQEKGRKRVMNKKKSRARKACDAFCADVLLVGTPTLLWYGWLIKNG